MPEPVRSGQRYMPGLDGLRAVAVFAVIAYHLGLGWAPGGMLGVGMFFTLSGYLITDLLLASGTPAASWRWATSGCGVPGDSCLRVVVMLAVVVIWVEQADRSQLAGSGQPGSRRPLREQLVRHRQHGSYFAHFAPPQPLGHLWSLAVEEQFYLLWPWVLWLGLRVIRRRRWHVLTILASPAPPWRWRPSRRQHPCSTSPESTRRGSTRDGHPCFRPPARGRPWPWWGRVGG